MAPTHLEAILKFHVFVLASLQEESKISLTFKDITKNLVSELVKRNNDLPPSEILKITTMAGCSAVSKRDE